MSGDLEKNKETCHKPEVFMDNTAATKLAKFLHKIAADEMQPFEHGRNYPFPFYAKESFFRKLKDEIIELLNEVPINENVEFKSVTRFQDLSSVTYDSFQLFLEKAGNKKDPESTLLSWSKFALGHDGEPITGEVQVSLITEKKLQTHDAPPGDFDHAHIKLSVLGSNHKWVENSFHALEPYIEAIKLGGVFRPLWFFRNKWFINILSQVLSWMGFIIGIRFVSRLFTKDIRIGKKEILDKIVSNADISSKIDLLAKQLLAPDNTPWWEPIVVIGAGALSFAIIFTLGIGLLPKLTPNSSIAIGLAGQRGRLYLNTFKFIVFTVIICGILVPIILEVVAFLF